MRETIIKRNGGSGYQLLRPLLNLSTVSDSLRIRFLEQWEYLLLPWLMLIVSVQSHGGELVSIATFNVENYLLESSGGRRIKPLASRGMVWDSLFEMNADVVFLQELGSEQALLNIRTNLHARGIDYPQAVFSETPGSSIHLGMLSKLPVTAVRHHTTNVFVLYGRAFRSSRAFLEVDIQLPKRTSLKVFAAHLKSKRPVHYADQWDLRTREAKMLRQLIERRMKKHPEQLLAVVGDFNDDPFSETLKLLKGATGKWKLTDARPVEGRPGFQTEGRASTGKRQSVWTHFFDDDDLFSRVDFILMNRNLSRIYRPDLSYVLDHPKWGEASDHRPVWMTFELP